MKLNIEGFQGLTTIYDGSKVQMNCISNFEFLQLMINLIHPSKLSVIAATEISLDFVGRGIFGVLQAAAVGTRRAQQNTQSVMCCIGHSKPF